MDGTSVEDASLTMALKAAFPWETDNVAEFRLVTPIFGGPLGFEADGVAGDFTSLSDGIAAIEDNQY